MRPRRTASLSLVAAALAACVLVGCTHRATAATAPPSTAGGAAPAAVNAGTAPQPAAQEPNNAGDIPDDQVFVKYTSPTGGYSLDVPEGWARTVNGADVQFTSAYDGVQVQVSDQASAPTAASARANEVPALQQTGQDVQVSDVRDVQLPSGPAVLIRYTATSAPNPVTNRQIRLENDRYLFFKDGKLATLTMWAPAGADNVDQWQRMAQSFQWG